MTDSVESSQGTFLAVIGMAGRFPGARNVNQLWRNLCDGVEGISFLTDEQLRAAGVSAAEFTDPNYVRTAAVLEGVDWFDAGFFGLSPKDASIMDPQHRHFLECSWEALENAGWTPDQFDGRIGVYAGSGMNSYLFHNLLANSELVAEAGIFLLKQTGNDKDVLATRVSYQFGLTGPSLSVQTACSTSLVAIHSACQSLLSHECDMALAGGVTIEIPHGRGYIYRQGEILSRDGHCRAFDADSTGTVFGSGVGVVVLRRLQDALRDGDFIHAIVRGTAINNDGARKVSYLAPSVIGQTEVVTEALAIAGVDSDSISYVETHGTGTAVGDPIEIRALTSAFNQSTGRKGFCAIGSLKTNIGHLDAAAGVAGFIKTVLALEHAQIPPSLNFSTPNPLIDFSNSPFFVNTALRAWDSNDYPRRAGITSLGIGGTNAHAILEEAPVTTSGDSRPWQLLTLSAKSPSAIEARCRDLAEHLVINSENLADVAFTCHVGRKGFALRRAIVCRHVDDAIDGLLHPTANRIISGTASEKGSSVAFLFSGQGSQYSGMGRGLYESEPEFKRIVDFCSDFLAGRLSVDLRGLLFPSENDTEDADRRLNETRFTQPALFVVEYAMAMLWQSWGIHPDAMIGHSIGEFAAACIAGVFSLESALEIVAERARLMQMMPTGVMAAVALSEDRLLPLLANELCVASVNSVQQCVVSGSEDSMRGFESALALQGVSCQRLRVSHAFHSSMMDPVLKPFVEFLGKYDYSPPRIPFISSATGSWISAAEACDPGYWARQLRNTVRFSPGISCLLKLDRVTFLEVGPGQTLLALAAQHNSFAHGENVSNELGFENNIRSDDNRLLVKSGYIKNTSSRDLGSIGNRHDFIGSIKSRHDPLSDVELLLSALGKLWVAGKKIDWTAFHAHEQRKRLPLPTYPFDHKSFWIEPMSPLDEVQPVSSIAIEASATVESKHTADPSSKFETSPALGELFHPIWKRSDLVHSLSRRSTGPWLILHAADRLGTQIAELIRRRGEESIEVIPGNGFRRLSEVRFQIDPAKRNDYLRLIADLNAVAKMPRMIVHLWSLVDEHQQYDALKNLENSQNSSFHSLLFLAQALGTVDIETNATIGVISNSLQQVAGEPIWCPERAVLLGPCGVIPNEFPNIDCRSIDVVLPPPANASSGISGQALTEIGSQIISELCFESKEQVVAYRRTQRWVRGFEPLARNRSPITLVKRGVYLITGGLGGIGLTLAQTLADSAQARLTLIGRGAFPERTDWDSWLYNHHRDDEIATKIFALRSIEEAGGEVMVATADVTDVKEISRVIAATRERFGTIDGVIHAAGVLEDALILKKEAASACRVLAPKVKGTLVLESVLADNPPELFIVMSSVSTLLAPPGQIDYVAANAFLDAFAMSRSSRKQFTISIQWPRWRDVGMAAESKINAPARRGVTHPLLQELVKDDPTERIYATDLILEKQWVVDEHRLRGGPGIFPGTAYIEMVRAAVADDDRGGALSIRNLSFELPLSVQVSSKQAIRLTIRRQAEEQSFTVTQSATPESDGWTVCARGDLALAESSFRKPQNLADIRQRCQVRELVFTMDRQNVTQEKYISFGPRWRCLKKVHLGRREALSEIELSNEFISDLVTYRSHPAIMDVATGSAMFLIPGYDRHEYLYIPVAYGSIAIFESLPAKCYAHIKAKGELSSDKATATFDISLLDGTGKLIVEIRDYTVQQIRDVAVLGLGQRNAAQRVSEIHQGSTDAVRNRGFEAAQPILPEQGIRAFKKILSGWSAPNVTLFMSDLSALLEERQHLRTNIDSGTSKGSASAPHSDKIEATVANWWKELLGLTEIDIRANFFEVGGQSLSAIRLLAKIKKLYGIDLNPGIMFEVPTIEGLANLIRNGDRESRHSSVISIRSIGSKPPLFLIHAVGGRLIGYNDLVKCLSSHQAVCGVQFDFAATHSSQMRMDYLAAHYMSEMRAAQPEGPYYLLGYSFGGLMAFEIAQQLCAAGEAVAFLGMLDTWQPRYLRSKRVSSRKRLIKELELRIVRAKNLLDSSGPSSLKGKLQERGLRFWNDFTGMGLRSIYSTCGAFGLAVPRMVQRPQDVNWYALARYAVREYPGRITLFRATEGIGAVDERYGEELGWNGIAKLGTEVHEIPGSHLELMREPNVRIVAQKLGACLDRIHESGRGQELRIANAN